MNDADFSPSPDEMAAARNTAVAAFHAARNNPDQFSRVSPAIVEQVWQTFADLFRRATHPPAAWRIVTEARAAMQAFGRLSDADRAALNWFEGNRANGTPEEAHARIRAVFLANPALAIYQAHEDAREAEMAAWREEARRRAADAQEADAPHALLAALRARGIAVKMDKAGAITVPESADLSEAEEAEIVKRKPALVAILTAEAQAEARASRPRRVA